MNYYNIEQLDSTGLVKTVYTPCRYGRWKYGEQEAVQNYIELGKALGITPDNMVRPSQTHTTTVQIVNESHAGNGVVRLPDKTDCDGLITNTKRLFLCTREADCVPVYMLDPVNGVVAMVHSGWRGTAGQIAVKAVEMMHDNFGTNPEKLLAAFGPSICKNCYEVGPELIADFKESYTQSELDELFTLKENGRYILDVSHGVEISLLRAGVNTDNIFKNNICTYENHDFSSYRRTHSYENHMLTGIMLI